MMDWIVHFAEMRNVLFFQTHSSGVLLENAK